MKNLIAFTGYMQSGKSTCANEVWMQRQGERYNIETIPFAAPIKDIAKRLGWNGLKTPEWRTFLQELGSSVRKINPDIWVDLWERERDFYQSEYVNFILVDDLRYNNEAERIHSLGGKIVLVNNPNCKEGEHESEKGIDKKYVDYTINNNGTLEDLEKEVSKMLEYFKI